MPRPRFDEVPAMRRRIMQRNRRRDTAPEVALRSLLHRHGMRFRVDHPIPVSQGRPIRPDIVFTRAKVAVFVDGCFWHGCPIHGTTPTTRAEYWIPKIGANRERDARHTQALEAAGWRVIRIWEHEDIVDAAARIARTVHARAA
jgi:DNA mismatch endonuclease, patch repair protein